MKNISRNPPVTHSIADAGLRPPASPWPCSEAMACGTMCSMATPSMKPAVRLIASCRRVWVKRSTNGINPPATELATTAKQ